MKAPEAELFANSKGSGATIKEAIFKYLAYWPLFIVSFAACITVSYLYLRYATPQYVANTLILVKDDDSKTKGLSNDLIKDALTGEQKDNLDNEIQIMRSKALMKRVVIKNQFNISYYRIGKFRKTDLYLDAPFRLVPQYIADSNQLVEFTIKKFTSQGVTILYGPKETPFVFTAQWNVPFKINKNQFVLTKHGQPVGSSDNFLATWWPVNEAAGEISGRFAVSLYDKKTSILQLSINIENLQRGQDILNAISREFIQTDIEDKNAVSQNALRFIDDRLDMMYKELTGVEGSLENYQGNNDIINVASQSSQSFDNSNTTSKTLTDNSIQQGVVEMIQSYFNDPSNKDKLVPSSLGINDATLATLIARYNELQLNKERQTPLVTSNSIVLKDINNQINDVKGSILESLQNITKNLKLQQNSLQQKNNQYSQFLSSLPHKERVMQEIKRKQTITEGLYLYLLQKREEAAISSSSSNVSLYKQIDDADSSGLVTPNQSHVYAYAIILGLLLPIGMVQLGAMLNDKIVSVKDVTDRLQIPVLGEITHMPRNKQQIIPVLERNLIGEQFRIVRTNLSFLLKNKDKQVILITSSGSGEGKSFVSLNLSAVLAAPGKTVALLEFDLRSPGITKKISMNNDKGISNYLVGEATKLCDIYQAYPGIPSLHIYPSGPLPGNPADLLLNENVTIFFDALKQQYDYIIIDTPPTGFVIDPFILSDFSNAVIYIVRQRYTLKKQLDVINEIYKTKKFNNMGLLVNDLKDKKTKGYGYTYGEVKKSFFSKMFGFIKA